MKEIKGKTTAKEGFHERNKHKGKYDFPKLIKANGELKNYVRESEYGGLTIDFFDPMAVKALNKALIIEFYGLDYWELPSGYLCPPIPSRADYIHVISDLTCCNSKQRKARMLDIGVGASCIFPIIGVAEYGWDFVGSDIHDVSISSSRSIIEKNASLKGKIEIRKQDDPFSIFRGVIKNGEFFEVSLCNPPFHDSSAEALMASKRKESNLKNKPVNKPTPNFSGQDNELWCSGGEANFLKNMIEESQIYRQNVHWFTTIVSSEDTLRKLVRLLKTVSVREHKIIPMEHGNKKTRILAWRY